jgi:hypothetical protein
MFEADELPTTVSSLYYDGVMAGAWPSDDEVKGAGGKRVPRQNVSDAVQWLIDRGHVHHSAVVDLSRAIVDYRGSNDLWQSTYDYAKNERLSPWKPEPVPVVIVESRSLASALATTAYDYLVTIAPVGGQGGRSFLRNDVVPLLLAETPVAYFGDWNLAGGAIEQSAASRLSDYAPEWTGTWETLAVVEADARALPPKRKLDRRTRPYRVFESVEAEALGTTALRGRLADWLDSRLPEGFSWDDHRGHERERRRSVLALLDS